MQNIKFENFLKKEFGLDFPNKKSILEADEIFEIEKNKKEIIQKIKKHNTLEYIIDKKFPLKNNIDIDDQIEEKWNMTFEKIRYELLNVENVLNPNNEKKHKSKIKNTAKQESLVIVWFGSFALVTTIFLLFFVLVDIVVPSYKNNNNIALEKNSQIYRKASIGKEAKIEYSKNNKAELNKDNINIDLADKHGKVAGVVEKKENKSFYQQIFDFFQNLF